MGRIHPALLLCALAAGCADESPPPSAPTAATVPAPSRRSASRTAALRGVELQVQGWAQSAHGLELVVAFENQGNAFGLAAGNLASGLHLEDGSGRTYELLAASPDLLAGLSRDGLPPKESRRGRLLFSLPEGDPFTLVVPSFEPLLLRTAELPQESTAELRPAATEKVSPELAAGAAPAEPADTALRRLVQTLLDRQAEAMLAGDFAAYLATFHRSRQTHERQVFRHAQQVPFSEVELRLRGDPATGTALLALPVELRYRLQEQPANNPFVNRVTYELILEEDGWSVHRIREDPRRPVFWRQDSLELHRSHHFLLYVWPGQARDVLEVARHAEAAYMTILQRGLPLAPRYVAHLVTDAELFRRAAGSPLAVGVALSRQENRDGGTYVDSRAFFLNGPLLAPYRLGRPDEEERRTTIAHELVHLAVAEYTRPHTPPWLVEGTAVYFSDGLDFDSNRRLVKTALDHISLPRLTEARALGQHDTRGDRIAYEYLYSGNLVAYLGKHFGNDRLLRFYRSYTDLPPLQSRGAPLSAMVARELTEQGLQQYFHLSIATFEAAAKESMRLQYR